MSTRLASLFQPAAVCNGARALPTSPRKLNNFAIQCVVITLRGICDRWTGPNPFNSEPAAFLAKEWVGRPRNSFLDGDSPAELFVNA